MKLAALTGLAAVKPEAADAADKRKLAEAARAFEGMLIRQMLTSLEKTTQMSGSKALGSQTAYSSMMVDALSDAIARAGGLGLADSLGATLTSQLESQAHPEPTHHSPVKPLK